MSNFVNFSGILFVQFVVISGNSVDFVENVIRNHFSAFALVLTHHSDSYTDQSFSHHEQLVSRIHQNNDETDLYLFNLNTNNSTTNTAFHRYSPQYFVTVAQLDSPDYGESLEAFITWTRSTELVRQDADYFIITSRKSSLQSILLSTAASKIKFKFALAIDDPKWDFTVHTACFYCDRGRPAIVNLNLQNRSLTLENLFPDHMLNFFGFKLRAAVSSKIVYRIEIFERDNQWFGKPGVHTNLLEHCRRKLNFTYELFPSIGGGGSGVRWPNGTWTGSMADVIYENADFGLVTAQTFDRHRLVTFSFPITYDWLTFVTGHPKQINSWSKIFRPLSLVIWVCLLPTIIAVTVAWYFLHQSTQIRRLSWFTVFWQIISPLLDKNIPYPETRSLRILCITWLSFSLIITVAYKAKLVPSLTLPHKQALPETFEQLTKSDYRWGMYYLAGAAYSAFRTSTNPIYVKLFNGMDIQHSAIQCLERAIQTPFACIIYEGSAVDQVHRSLGDKYGRNPIVVAPATTFFISSCWVMEKRAIFERNFHRIMRKAMEMGLNMHWVDMNYQRIRKERVQAERKTSCKASAVRIDDDGPKALGFKTVVGPIYVWSAGVTIGFVAFVLEKLHRTYTSKNQSFSHELKSHDITIVATQP